MRPGPATSSLRCCPSASGSSAPSTRAPWTARANLAYWTGVAGDAAGARDQYAALLPIRERVSGPEHPGTLTARANLAYWTGEAGDAAGARDQYAALLPIRERVLGAEHPGTLAVRANLAYWTGEAGDAAGARDQYAALLPVRERVLGAEHPGTLADRANLAHWTERSRYRGRELAPACLPGNKPSRRDPDQRVLSGGLPAAGLRHIHASPHPGCGALVGGMSLRLARWPLTRLMRRQGLSPEPAD